MVTTSSGTGRAYRIGHSTGIRGIVVTCSTGSTGRVVSNCDRISSGKKGRVG